jgi:hypothetical protein
VLPFLCNPRRRLRDPAQVSDDCTCVIWDVSNGCKRYTQESVIETGHSRNIFGVAFLPGCNDRWLVTGAMDCQVRVHVVREDTSAACVRVFTCHSDRVKHIETEPMEVAQESHETQPTQKSPVPGAAAPRPEALRAPPFAHKLSFWSQATPQATASRQKNGQKTAIFRNRRPARTLLDRLD